MIATGLVLLSLFITAAVLWMTVLHQERQHQRRELHRRLIVHAAEQQMRRLDQAALSMMFDAVRRQGR